MENMTLSDCLVIGTGCTAVFAFLGFCFFIMELFRQKQDGEKIPFGYAIGLGFIYVCFAALIGIIFSLIVCAITYVACALGLDPANMPENPYF